MYNQRASSFYCSKIIKDCAILASLLYSTGASTIHSCRSKKSMCPQIGVVLYGFERSRRDSTSYSYSDFVHMSQPISLGLRIRSDVRNFEPIIGRRKRDLGL